MGKGTRVLKTLKSIGNWVVQNQYIIMEVADKVIKLKSEDKVNQLGAAVVELEQKIDSEIILIRKQLCTMKIIILVMGIVLTILIIAIILFAIY